MCADGNKGNIRSGAGVRVVTPEFSGSRIRRQGILEAKKGYLHPPILACDRLTLRICIKLIHIENT